MILRREIRRGVRVGGFAVLSGLLGLGLLLFHFLGIARNGLRGRMSLASRVESEGSDSGEEGDGLEFHGSMSSSEADWLRLRAEALSSERMARIV